MRLYALLAIPVLAALLLLAAHLIHAGWIPLAVLAMLLTGLLAVRRPWAARTLQFVLACAALEWVRTTVTLAALRAQHDAPYLRLVAILGAVTALTAIAAAVIEHPAFKEHFRQRGGDSV